MKKNSLRLSGILCAVSLLAGCAVGGDVPESGSGEGFREMVESSSLENGITENNDQNSDNQESGTQTAAEPRQLTPEELEQFTAYMGRMDNYGFLLSYYSRAGEVDLGEVLYNGAGMGTEPLSESERKAYEAAGYTIETDITRLTTGQIEEFLQKKMGIGMADVTGGLGWVYLEEFDSYVFQHGDTNYCRFICTDGLQTEEDEYEIHCTAEETYVPDCVVTLRKMGEEYQFRSCRPAADAEDAGGSRGKRECVE